MKLKNNILISIGLLTGLLTFAQPDAQKDVEARFNTFGFDNIKQQHTVTNMPFNSKFSDFGAYEHNGNIYFASSRDEGVLVKHIDERTNEPFLDIYVTNKGSEETPVDHKSKLKGKVNTVFHEGSLAITKDGQTMYFCRNDFNNQILGADENLITHLKIYKATLKNDRWTNIEELPFNGTKFSNAHPALNEDETKLYFASDMKGSIGGSDIFYVDIHSDGTFGTPQNLGNLVNTKKDEGFPFISSEGTLFFASEGHEGFGLLDVFEAVSDTNNRIINVVNLGEPVNSNKDDFAYFLNNNGLTGYFASNREGGVGSDDIYAFNRIPQLAIEGTVTDVNTNEPIANTKVTLLDTDGKEITYVETNDDGYYKIIIDRDTDYVVATKKDAFEDHAASITSKNIERHVKSLTADFALNPVKKEAIPIAALYPIYFDFNKSVIRKDGTSELDRIVDLMVNKYPGMTIKIESHTDSRGSSAYNDKLSQARAVATYNYLISQGVDPARIVEYKGYGEQNLINNCDGTTRCTEDKHQLNRRTQFKVIQME
ncbi:OmpA family protein [Flaviramulus multivorans]